MSLALLVKRCRVGLELNGFYIFRVFPKTEKEKNTLSEIVTVCKSKVFTRRSFTEVCQPLPWGVERPRLQLTSALAQGATRPRPLSPPPPTPETHTCSAFLAFSFPLLGRGSFFCYFLFILLLFTLQAANYFEATGRSQQVDMVCVLETSHLRHCSLTLAFPFDFSSFVFLPFNPGCCS